MISTYSLRAGQLHAGEGFISAERMGTATWIDLLRPTFEEELHVEALLGCELPTRVLEDLQKSGAFAHWELRGRELVLYWRKLAPKAEQKLTLDLVARVPGTTTGAASRAYLYYAPGQKRWAAPLQVTIAAK